MSVATGSGKASRTRRDIVEAAINAWAADNSRSLGDVADAAGVGRTTLNRHFSNRAELVAAVDAECRDRFAQALARSRPDEGSGLAGLQRACTEIIQLGPVLGLIFADNALVDPDTWGHPDTFGLLIIRGQADGSVASDLPADWVAIHTWTTLFAAQLMLQTGSATGHEVSELLIRTLASGIAA